MDHDDLPSINSPIHHLDSNNGEAWMGLIDAIYAIAMTLIAIELPELIISLVNLGNKNIGNDLITTLISYEFIAYTSTFLMLYELWTVHKSILKLGGIKRQIQNVLNGLIMALTCLGASNVILVLNEKTKDVADQVRPNTTHGQLLSDWINNDASFGMVTLLLLLLMFFLMSLLSRSSQHHNSSQELRKLTRDLNLRCLYFVISSVIWIPAFFSESMIFPPALVIALFLLLSFNQDSIEAWLKHRRSHT